jgi:hypothetical protein
MMRGELHRNQVTDAQTIHENLRDAAYHEAGHIVVARFLGLTVQEVEIEEDGSGRPECRVSSVVEQRFCNSLSAIPTDASASRRV